MNIAKKCLYQQMPVKHLKSLLYAQCGGVIAELTTSVEFTSYLIVPTRIFMKKVYVSAGTFPLATNTCGTLYTVCYNNCIYYTLLLYIKILGYDKHNITAICSLYHNITQHGCPSYTYINNDFYTYCVPCYSYPPLSTVLEIRGV